MFGSKLVGGFVEGKYRGEDMKVPCLDIFPCHCLFSQNNPQIQYPNTALVLRIENMEVTQ